MDITHLLNQTIFVAACTSLDADGTETHSSPAARAARVEYGSGNEPGTQGEELRTPMRIATLTAIGPRDRIWLPGVTPASATTTGFRYPGPGGSKPAVDLRTGNTMWYETEV